MFRPFLPGGIAYGFAYALPMAFHALFPAEGIPPGCLYCTISARCLSTGFGRISAAFAFFRRRGVPPCRGGIAPALQARRALTAPCGAEPQRHLFTLPRGRGPSQTPPSLATDSSISPGPPSPWLPALSPVSKQKPLVVQVPSLAQARGCKGQSPLHKKTKNLPLPAGKGGGGMGAEKQAKSRVGRRQGRHAPRRALSPQAQPMPLPAQPRGCKGQSPLHKQTKNSPFPGGEGGRGDILPLRGRGAEKQAKGKVSQRGGELFQESPGASLSPPGATAVLPQKRRRRSASDRGSPTAHRSAQCGGKSWR